MLSTFKNSRSHSFSGCSTCTHNRNLCKWLTHYECFTSAAIDVVTVYVFHEPSLLSSLQDNGLTGVMLKALVVKEVNNNDINMDHSYRGGLPFLRIL